MDFLVESTLLNKKFRPPINLFAQSPNNISISPINRGDWELSNSPVSGSDVVDDELEVVELSDEVVLDAAVDEVLVDAAAQSPV